MRKLSVFNSVTLDGFFTDANGDISWAHQGSDDPEFNAFTAGNAKGGGTLVFGRVTYEMMAAYWPTPEAARSMPMVAEQMNKLEKVVFSRKLDEAGWNNTTLVKEDPVGALRTMKQGSGPDMTIMGSGSLIAPLAQARIIDAYQFVVCPIILGKGRTMFDGVNERLDLRLTDSRRFANGKVVLRYEPNERNR
jgi:dihydrofolate reductase